MYGMKLIACSNLHSRLGKSVKNSNIVVPRPDTFVKSIKMLHNLHIFLISFPLDSSLTYKYITRGIWCILCYRDTSEAKRYTQYTSQKAAICNTYPHSGWINCRPVFCGKHYRTCASGVSAQTSNVPQDSETQQNVCSRLADTSSIALPL